jgi:HEPN domain-containing protein
MPSPRTPAQTFLAKAREDLYQVQKNLDDAQVSDEQFGFFCQQSIEKSIKAVLTHRLVSFRYGHALETYIRLCEDNGIPIPSDLVGCEILTPYASELRYGFLPELSEEDDPLDRTQAAAWSHTAVRWAASVIGP